MCWYIQATFVHYMCQHICYTGLATGRKGKRELPLQEKEPSHIYCKMSRYVYINICSIIQINKISKLSCSKTFYKYDLAECLALFPSLFIVQVNTGNGAVESVHPRCRDACLKKCRNCFGNSLYLPFLSLSSFFLYLDCFSASLLFICSLSNIYISSSQNGTDVEEWGKAKDGRYTQPLLLSTGNARNPEHYFIVLDRIAIPVGRDAVKAVDMLFKSHYVFNVEYAAPLQNFWEFIAAMIYAVIEPFATGPTVRTLGSSCRDIKL